MLADARAWLTRMTATPDGVLRYLLLAAAMEEDEARSACTAAWASHVEHSLAELLESARTAGAADERAACAQTADRIAASAERRAQYAVGEAATALESRQKTAAALARLIRARGPGG